MATPQQQEEDSKDDLAPSRSFYQTTKMDSLNYNMTHQHKKYNNITSIRSSQR